MICLTNNINPFTFDFTVFCAWDESVSKDIQAVNGSVVAKQHHHTHVCLQIPASTGKMKY